MRDTYGYFLAALRHVLETTQLTQKKLADTIETAPQTMNAIVTGRANAGGGRQEKIAKACGYSLIDFITMGKTLCDSEEAGRKEPPSPETWKHAAELEDNKHGKPQTRQRAFYIWEELACNRAMNFPGSFDSTVLQWQLQDYIDGKLTDEELYEEAIEWCKKLIRRTAEYYQERARNTR